MTGPGKPSAAVVDRQRKFTALWEQWVADHPGANPDDDPEFVRRARKIMGLPPLAEAPS